LEVIAPPEKVRYGVISADGVDLAALGGKAQPTWCQVRALTAGAPLIGEWVKLRQYCLCPPAEVVPRLHILPALAYHLGNGCRVSSSTSASHARIAVS
jgi:hypothetical protein